MLRAQVVLGSLVLLGGCTPAAGPPVPAATAPAAPCPTFAPSTAATAPAAALPCWPVRDELRSALLRGAGAGLTEAGWSKEELSCDEMAAITRLTLGPVWSLAGLEPLTGLVELSIQDVEDGSLAPIARHRSLRALRIAREGWDALDRGTHVVDLAPLAGFSDLEELLLPGGGVADLTPLAGLTALRTLDLRRNRVSDPGPLAGLVRLRELRVGRNTVTSVAPLAKLADLEVLDLHDNRVQDVTALAGLARLREVDLSQNPVEDVSALAGLSALESINLDSTKVKDVSALTRLPALKELLLCHSPASLQTPPEVLRAFAKRDVRVMRGGGCHS